METFGKFMALLLGITISPIIRGFVFLKLWAWFVVPIFQLQPLKIFEAIGILILLQFIYIKTKDEKQKEEFWENFMAETIVVILISAFALFIGWIVSLLI